MNTEVVVIIMYDDNDASDDDIIMMIGSWKCSIQKEEVLIIQAYMYIGFNPANIYIYVHWHHGIPGVHFGFGFQHSFSPAVCAI